MADEEATNYQIQLLERRLAAAEAERMLAEEAAATATATAAESARVAMECANDLTRVTRCTDARVECLRRALWEADLMTAQWRQQVEVAESKAAEAARRARERKEALMQFKQTAPAPRSAQPSASAGHLPRPLPSQPAAKMADSDTVMALQAKLAAAGAALAAAEAYAESCRAEARSEAAARDVSDRTVLGLQQELAFNLEELVEVRLQLATALEQSHLVAPHLAGSPSRPKTGTVQRAPGEKDTRESGTKPGRPAAVAAQPAPRAPQTASRAIDGVVWRAREPTSVGLVGFGGGGGGGGMAGSAAVPTAPRGYLASPMVPYGSERPKSSGLAGVGCGVALLSERAKTPLGRGGSKAGGEARSGGKLAVGGRAGIAPGGVSPPHLLPPSLHHLLPGGVHRR